MHATSNKLHVDTACEGLPHNALHSSSNYSILATNVNLVMVLLGTTGLNASWL